MRRKLREMIEARDGAVARCQERIFEAKGSYGGRLKKLKEDYAESSAEKKANHQQFSKQALTVFDSRQSRIDKALNRMLAEINGRKSEELSRLDEELREEKVRVADRNRPQSDASAEKLTWLQEKIGKLRDSAEVLREQVRRSAEKRNAPLPGKESDAASADGEGADEWAPTNIESDVEAVSKDLSLARLRIAGVHGSLAGILSSRVALIMAYVLVLGVGACVSALVIHGGQSVTSFAYIGVGMVCAVIVLVYYSSARATGPVLSELSGLWVFMNERLDRLERLGKAAKEELGPLRFLDKQIHEIMGLEKGLNKRRDRAIEEANAASTKLRARHERLQNRLQKRRDDALKDIEAEFGGGAARFQKEHEGEIQRLESEWKNSDRQAVEDRDNEIDRLAGEWKRELAEFSEFSAGAMGSRGEALAAREQNGGPVQLPGDFPQSVFVGQTHVDLARLEIPADEEADGRFRLPEKSAFDLPLALCFPTCGSLQVEAAGTGRERAIDTLLSASLSLLRSFPAGKIKLTLLDPVGLGESFAGLMQLSEYDETLVRGRIWTETAHIERKLSDLTERIEKVIQNYLRNRYATVADYNKDAGQLAEPYEFLVVADYPSGFSDLAKERLASVLTSGPRCGVYTLLHCSKGAKLPDEADAETHLRSTMVLRDDGTRLSLEHDGLRKSELAVDPLPQPEAMSDLLDGIGKCSSDVQQVELPFEAIVPAEKDIWSMSAAGGIRVPIGRTGAERLQYLDLGKGTAQHALVAGRTGSGKSTLFHVVITASALWFSPREVEFYLVDFKHGVEFKMFASRRLPHARVIAIESDREFGLSVLQKINEELTRRGNMFRKVGVQDLAGYREAAPDEHLTRLVLMIDEFQEFFTDDDIIARDAALLLDRFVRQGRAFGIHVILGSQTLSGMYTLAKSTLGQMGVRIALQCNEADSQLILSEDNTAARLLSHSGEAIYNDMSGLLEGNSPFQVVWLPESTQDAQLKGLAGRCEQHPEHQPDGKCVVFEGSAPADLGDNPLLAELISKKKPPATAAGRTWVGAASAIKGPTEVRFLQAGGGNLLILGQNREAAFATVASMVVGLAAGHGGKDDARFIMFEGEGQSAEYATHLEALTEAIGPERLSVPLPREIETVLGEVTKEHLDEADSGGGKGNRRTYLIVFGLQRFRALRQEDSFSLSMDDDAATSPGEMFANLLREGAEHGVHCIVWCDTLNNLTRAVQRSVLREFDMRVLFQMSGADSSEICDSTAASNLGLYKALLAIQSDGSFEKFRPYSTPDPEYLQEVKRLLARRGG